MELWAKLIPLEGKGDLLLTAFLILWPPRFFLSGQILYPFLHSFYRSGPVQTLI